MKGRRWLQIEPVPSHGLCYQSRREGRKLDCSSPLLLGRNCSSLVTVTMTGHWLNLQPPLPPIFPCSSLMSLCQVQYQYCKISDGIPMHQALLARTLWDKTQYFQNLDLCLFSDPQTSCMSLDDLTTVPHIGFRSTATCRCSFIQMGTIDILTLTDAY